MKKLKYKVGDRVKIIIDPEYHQEVLAKLAKLTDRTVTISKVGSNNYRMKEIEYLWYNDEIDCLVKEVFVPITSRFEILDIR